MTGTGNVIDYYVFCTQMLNQVFSDQSGIGIVTATRIGGDNIFHILTVVEIGVSIHNRPLGTTI